MDRFISIDEVVDNAKTIILDADDKSHLLMRQWVYLGVKQIGVSLDNIEVCTLNAHDGSFRKPDNFLIVDDIALYDDSDNEYQMNYRGPGTRIHKATEPLTPAPIDLSEDDYYFHMGSSGCEYVTKAVIRYYALPLDEYGDVKIAERYLLALMFFLKFMWDTRQNNATREESKINWTQNLLKQKALNRAPSPLAAEYTARKLNSMINKIMYRSF